MGQPHKSFKLDIIMITRFKCFTTKVGLVLECDLRLKKLQHEESINLSATGSWQRDGPFFFFTVQFKLQRACFMD